MTTGGSGCLKGISDCMVCVNICVLVSWEILRKKSYKKKRIRKEEEKADRRGREKWLGGKLEDERDVKLGKAKGKRKEEEF